MNDGSPVVRTFAEYLRTYRPEVYDQQVKDHKESWQGQTESWQRQSEVDEAVEPGRTLLKPE